MDQFTTVSGYCGMNKCHVNKEEREALGLPLSYHQVRNDGYVFIQYYKRNGKIYEQWLSPESVEKQKKRKASAKKHASRSNFTFAKRVKMFLGCSECGYKKHPDALHFDHLNPELKTKEISRMHGYSRERLKNEMRKCRVLCANCHAIHGEAQRREKLKEEYFKRKMEKLNAAKQTG